MPAPAESIIWMSSSLRADETTMPARSDPGAERRSLVLVAGSGRSGTSLFTGILQRLGFHVPRPEVPADNTNPKGFAESQWVVDFHTAALRRAGVQVSDARPTAWAHMAQVVVEDEMVEKLRHWLDSQFKEADHLIIKDPRLSWFLPLWTRSAEDFGVTPRLATVPAPSRGGGREQAALLRRLGERGGPDCRVAQPGALHGTSNARGSTRFRPLRGHPRRLDDLGRPVWGRSWGSR